MKADSSRALAGLKSGIAVCALFFVLCSFVEAQQAVVPKVGWLGARSTSAPTLEVFHREIRTLGYVEGKNIAFEHRYADGKLDRLPSLADELVRLKVDILVAPASPAAVAARM